MANRYWVGGAASWDGTVGTKWATTSGGAGGASVPTSADDVFLDANSGTGTVTIASGNTGAKSLTCTGFTGTLSGTSTLTVSGNVTLSTGMSTTTGVSLIINATSTVISAGKTIGTFQINGSGITVTLGDALTVAGTMTVTAGTFTSDNFNVTASSLSSNNSNTRTINLGSSTVTLTTAGSSGGANCILLGGTSLTFDAGTSQITASGTVGTSGSSFVTFSGGGYTFYNVTSSSNSGANREAGDFYITGANTFNNLTISPPSTAVKSVGFSANQTINGTLTVAGAAANRRVALYSDTFGTSRTLTAAAISATDCDFRDITLAGAASPASPTRAGNCKGNSGITFPAAKTVYWNRNATTSDWSSDGWATSSGGTAATTNYPLPQDTAVFDNTGIANTIRFLGVNLPTIDMSARTSAFTFDVLTTNSTELFVYGNWTSGTGLSFTGSSSRPFTFAGRSTQTITSNGVSLRYVSVDSPSGTLQLIDDLTISNTGIILKNGTLDLNGKTLSTPSFTVGVGTKNITFNGGTIAVNSVFTSWSNTAPTGFTTTAGSGTGKISMTSASAKTFEGGGSTYNCTLSNDGAGALTVSGSNTFTTITNGVQPATFTFTSGTTQTVTNFNVNGTAGNLVTINATSTSAATLSKATGTVTVDFVNISYSTATGGAVWNVGTNSVNSGNNTGWTFLPNGSLLVFFL